MFVRIFFLLFFTSLMLTQASAQELVPVDVSEEIVVVSGKRYHLHQVEPRQTLFSISRAYGVSVEALYQSNEGLREEGLKLGTRIKIPADDAHGQQLDHEKYVYHVIQPGETLYSLSRRYGIAVDVIVDNNEVLEESSLQLGQVIKIPKRRIDSEDKTDVRDEDGYIIHEVKRRETLYALSRLYGVSIDDIIRLNKEVAEDGLKHRQTIRIPAEPADFSHQAILDPKAQHIQAMPVDTVVDFIFEIDCDTLRLDPNKKALNIAVMLPFYTHRNTLETFMADSNLYRGMSAERKKRLFIDYIYPKSRVSLDLYEGILMAVAELKEKGLVDVNLYVYDTRADSNVVKSLLSGPNIRRMDLIIGPAFHYNFQLVANFVKEYEIPVVSPLSSRYLCEGNPFTFQAKPTEYIQLGSFLRYVKEAAQDANFLMVYDTHIADYDIVELYRQMLPRYFPPQIKEYKDTAAPNSVPNTVSNTAQGNTVSVDTARGRRVGAGVRYDTLPSIMQVIHGEELRERVQQAMDTNKVNYVFIPSEREAFVTNVTSVLNALTLTHEVKLLGMPAWQQFRTIDLDEFYNLDLVYYTPYHIDWQDTDLLRWVQRYRARYDTDIFRVASDGANHSLLGYDIANYFLEAYVKHGKDFRHCLPAFEKESLLTTFRYKQSVPEDGYVNRSISIIRFDKATLGLKQLVR